MYLYAHTTCLGENLTSLYRDGLPIHYHRRLGALSATRSLRVLRAEHHARAFGALSPCFCAKTFTLSKVFMSPAKNDPHATTKTQGPALDGAAPRHVRRENDQRPWPMPPEPFEQHPAHRGLPPVRPQARSAGKQHPKPSFPGCPDSCAWSREIGPVWVVCQQDELEVAPGAIRVEPGAVRRGSGSVGHGRWSLSRTCLGAVDSSAGPWFPVKACGVFSARRLLALPH